MTSHSILLKKYNLNDTILETKFGVNILKIFILKVPDETLHTFTSHFEVRKFRAKLDKLMKIFHLSFRTQKYFKDKIMYFIARRLFAIKVSV